VAQAASSAGPVNLESMLRSSAGPVMPAAVVKTASLVVLLGNEDMLPGVIVAHRDDVCLGVVRCDDAPLK
jgi:hypothetical protein